MICNYVTLQPVCQHCGKEAL